MIKSLNQRLHERSYTKSQLAHEKVLTIIRHQEKVKRQLYTATRKPIRTKIKKTDHTKC